jgi:hypothetical protein
MQTNPWIDERVQGKVLKEIIFHLLALVGFLLCWRIAPVRLDICKWKDTHWRLFACCS